MQILIDTVSNLGIVDYSACLQYTERAMIVRRLNMPSACTLSLYIDTSNLPVPPLLASVQIATSAGLVLFTGYLSEAPELCVLGRSDGLSITAFTINAMSDEIVFDADQVSSNITLLGLSPASSWGVMTRLASTPLQVTLAGQLAASSRTLIAMGSRWSEAAGTLAAQTGSSYRCLAGAIQAIPVGESVSVVAASDPGLSFKPTPPSEIRWLARDVTIFGREEPTAYVTEIFVGDGSSSTFTLGQTPFTPVSAQKVSLLDLFQGTSLNSKVWNVKDPGAHLALTASGLTCNGGSGRDGETVVSAWQQVELGGSITVEATGLMILPGSAGQVIGLYTDQVLSANCLAGYQVKSVGKSVTLTAEMAGASVGPAFNLQPGHMYTLRLRVYSPEMERVRQSYVALTNGCLSTIGGDAVSSTGQMTFEVQETTNGVLGATTVIFDGALSGLPPTCSLGLINSGNLVCSIRSVQCSQTGPLRVTVGPSASVQASSSIATSAEGGSCHVTTTGAVSFYPAAIPSANEIVIVSYRLRGISAARRSLPPVVGQSALPPTLTWIGTVTEPIAWSSNDCENVASAILAFASAGSSALEGTYSSTTESDVWPGDMLSIGPRADGTMLDVVVRKSMIRLSPDVPEEYATVSDFATPNIAGAGFKLSPLIPPGTMLPQVPTNIAEALSSLVALTVSEITSTSLTILTGIMPPINGGFEVRRRDSTFGPGTDSDLVLRTVATVVSIPRSYPVEQFYIRMYDASQPPNYSQFSAVVCTNMPLGG